MRGWKGQGRRRRSGLLLLGGGLVSARSEELPDFHKVTLEFVWAAPGLLLGKI